ncbi:MAG: response regulator, partial [Odoribacter sp.]|nr:response regulator [Odoribacter sp.]
PLNAIVGFSKLLFNTENTEKKSKFIDIIENNNQLLLQLINDVLDLAKIEANTLEFYYQPADLNSLTESVENTVRLRVKPGVALNRLVGVQNCVIQTEPNRLSQVLINLLTNACKFTEQGSIDFGYVLNKEELYFFVKDTGIGISAETQAKLFQRFSKQNSFAQGTGLGLSISKTIIEKMGGRIGVESAGEGKGSTFWFTLPYLPVEQTEASVVVEEAPKDSISKGEITVLIAEDNESNYLLFQAILEPEYRLIHAWDGVEAVELYKQHKPQVILMDINMPNKDGYEAAREIRQLSPTVPIIAVTAYAFISDKKRIMDTGFNSYVSKPLNADKLMQELKSVLGKSFIML